MKPPVRTTSDRSPRRVLLVGWDAADWQMITPLVERGLMPTLAAMMKAAAEGELGVPVRWTEDRSADTRENARFSAELLRGSGVRTVLLVTSAWHMPRAVDCLRDAGLDVVPAPTGFRGEVFASWTSFVPHWNGLRDSCLAMHEWGGRFWYALSD